MATQVVNTDNFGTGYRIDLSTTDNLWVGRNGLVVSTNGSKAIDGTGSNHLVHIEGAVSGVNGVWLGNDASVDTGNSVVIARTGVVNGTTYGVGIQATNARLNNFGLIHGGDNAGVYFVGIGSGMSRIDNGGDIISSNTAVVHGGTETLSLSNTGTMRGDIAAFFSTGAIAIDLIRNMGEMIGDIILGGGADLYDGRGGFVDGTVYGEDGNDTFRAGGGIEVFEGGAGIDTLDFRSTAGVHVYLDGSGPNTGTAEGDDYFGIENVDGSARRADVLVGDDADNVLRGFGGADSLSGGDGADSLAGGAGIDQLTGGAGNDMFVFESLGGNGDVISDFGAAVGNNDAFQISASGFGGGLVNGALLATQFQSRTDNVAQDANDRFIFRTTDKTLWFDANGNAAGGLLMVADLQAGAVVTAADILIY